MTLFIIIGILLGIIAFIVLGYCLWSTAKEKYNHNIFGMGVLLRGFLSLGCILLLSSSSLSNEAQIAYLAIALCLWLWTFIVTWVNTSFLIALFSIIYQVTVIYLINSALNKTLQLLERE